MIYSTCFFTNPDCITAHDVVLQNFAEMVKVHVESSTNEWSYDACMTPVPRIKENNNAINKLLVVLKLHSTRSAFIVLCEL